MPDALTLALATPGLGWMALTIFAAGLIRGFTGFGTALIFVPVASQFLPVAQVILIMAATGIVSTTALLSRAWAAADRGEVATMAVAALATVPFGLWLLSLFDLITARWVIVAFVTVTLVAIAAGWRWHGRLGVSGRLAVGGAAGAMGGMTGLTGPVIIMFYFANARSAEAMRANSILFLASLDVFLCFNLLIAGSEIGLTLWIALVLIPPYLGAVIVGQRLFDPSREQIHRALAYALALAAVISSLPILD